MNNWEDGSVSDEEDEGEVSLRTGKWFIDEEWERVSNGAVPFDLESLLRT